MNRLRGLSIASIALLAASHGEALQRSTNPQAKVFSNAVVTSVSTASFAATADGEQMTFVVDANTRVIAKGQAVRAIPIPPATSKPPQPFLKKGDHVSVTYRNERRGHYATRIEVIVLPPKL
jgi:hypothetical protein